MKTKCFMAKNGVSLCFTCDFFIPGIKMFLIWYNSLNIRAIQSLKNNETNFNISEKHNETLKIFLFGGMHVILHSSNNH